MNEADARQIVLDYNAKKITRMDICKITGINYSTLSERLRTQDLFTALTVPVKKHKKSRRRKKVESPFVWTRHLPGTKYYGWGA